MPKASTVIRVRAKVQYSPLCPAQICVKQLCSPKPFICRDTILAFFFPESYYHYFYYYHWGTATGECNQKPGDDLLSHFHFHSAGLLLRPNSLSQALILHSRWVTNDSSHQFARNNFQNLFIKFWSNDFFFFFFCTLTDPQWQLQRAESTETSGGLKIMTLIYQPPLSDGQTET